jgi:excisionase family DNA binding protein
MDLLTVKETAEMLRVSTVTVRRYIASGKLAAVRVGRNIRIRREDAIGAVTPRYTSKSVDWRDENHPLMKMMGFIKDDGPTDLAENHDKYLAEAYADTHEDDDTPFTNPDGDTTLKPLEWLEKNDPMFWTSPGGAHEGKPKFSEDDPIVSGIDPRFADKSDEWLLENHPLLKMIGLASDREGKTDIAENHDFYLAEAHSDTHEESNVNEGIAESRGTYLTEAPADAPSNDESPLAGIKPKFADKSVEWRLRNHPLIQSIGFIKDVGPGDYSVNHDKYLADAYADNHEE